MIIRPLDVDVLILAGGAGTRARSYLGDTPKFLAPIDGKPFYYHLLEYLSEQGFRRIVLSLGNGADAIIASLKSTETKHYIDGFLTQLDISACVEKKPCGRVSALMNCYENLLSDPVMILNGDTLLDLDMEVVLSRYKSSGALAMTVVNAEPYMKSTGCILISRKLLNRMVVDNLVTQDLEELVSNYAKLTTSRSWVDIGTSEGYEEACSSYGYYS